VLAIAGWQSAAGMHGVEERLDRLRSVAVRARERGTQLLVTPEMHATGYELTPEQLRERVDQDLIGPIRSIAAEAGLAMIVGSPVADGDRVYNGAVFINERGDVKATYRKSHLFGDLDRGLFHAGEEPFTMVEHHGVRIAMMICYDVEFPETVRAASLAGADIVIVPTAQMEPFDFVAESLIRTRAWENQIYVAYINHSGPERDLTYVGKSSIVGPDARVIDSIDGGDGLIYAVIDTAEVASAQATNPYLDDRQHHLYQGLIKPDHDRNLRNPT